MQGGINEKGDTLEEILPQKTDSARLTDNERVSRSDEGRGLVGDGQTPRSGSEGPQGTPPMACFQRLRPIKELNKNLFILYRF